MIILRFFTVLILFSATACKQKIGKHSLPPETKPLTIMQEKLDTLNGEILVNKEFNKSHFVQIIDGNTTILKVVLHDHQPEEVKDGGQKITLYSQIEEPSKLSEGLTVPIRTNLFRNRLEMIFDPSYDTHEEESLVGEMKILKIETNETYIIELSLGDEGSTNHLVRQKIVKYTK